MKRDFPFEREVSAELRSDVERMKKLIQERDEELRYAVANDHDDTGKRETVFIFCGCSYCRRTQEVRECQMHADLASTLSWTPTDTEGV